MWNGAPVGVAETFYPHPRGWRFEGEPQNSNLERMTVRRLTALFRKKHVATPSCVAKWASLTGVDMTTVQRRLCSPLISPRDFKNYYRVLHRAIRTRNFAGGPDLMCRLCGRYHERFSHLGECVSIRRTFRFFRNLIQPILGKTDIDDRLIYLGVRGNSVLPGSLSDLHIILWKFILIAFTRAETVNARYKPRQVWRQAVCRFEVRVRALGERQRHLTVRKESRGKGRELSSSRRAHLESQVAPLATVDEVGRLEWVPQMSAAIAKARTRA